MGVLRQGWVFLPLLLLVLGCRNGTEDGPAPLEPRPDGGEPPFLLEPPRGFPRVPVPAANPLSAAKVELGRRLFHDTRLSRDGSVSCASCHRPEAAFSDAGRAKSFGIHGRRGRRNSPSVANAAYGPFFLFEGGAPTLELQALVPILDTLEMGMRADSLERRLGSIPLYRELALKAFGDDSLTFARMTKALAAFERTLLSGASPYDRYLQGGKEALTESQRRGADLFFGEKGDCFHCHNGFNFTDNGFHNTGLDGVGDGAETGLEAFDPGRLAVTGKEEDRGKFKTPGLRNIAVTGPYMHDGRFESLAEVVAHYNSGGKKHPQADPLLRPLGLDKKEEADLVAFLESLTDSAFLRNPAFTNPWIP